MNSFRLPKKESKSIALKDISAANLEYMKRNVVHAMNDVLNSDESYMKTLKELAYRYDEALVVVKDAEDKYDISESVLKIVPRPGDESTGLFDVEIGIIEKFGVLGDSSSEKNCSTGKYTYFAGSDKDAVMSKFVEMIDNMVKKSVGAIAEIKLVKMKFDYIAADGDTMIKALPLVQGNVCICDRAAVADIHKYCEPIRVLKPSYLDLGILVDLPVQDEYSDIDELRKNNSGVMCYADHMKEIIARFRFLHMFSDIKKCKNVSIIFDSSYANVCRKDYAEKRDGSLLNYDIAVCKTVADICKCVSDIGFAVDSVDISKIDSRVDTLVNSSDECREFWKDVAKHYAAPEVFNLQWKNERGLKWFNDMKIDIKWNADDIVKMCKYSNTMISGIPENDVRYKYARFSMFSGMGEYKWKCFACRKNTARKYYVLANDDYYQAVEDVVDIINTIHIDKCLADLMK